MARTNNLDAAPNETTQLLPGDDEEAASPKTPKHQGSSTPLPKAQLASLVAVRLVDPIAYQQIFPYINQLLADMKVAEPEQVGFYSGLVESAYSLAQVFSVYQWGKISDVVGRRPVVFGGLLGIAVTSITFGLSTSFAGIIASRFLGGLVAGNIAVIHSILSEITDDTNQDVAISVYSLAWPTGTIIGPLIGGSFENAATRYPQYFSWHLFVEHPYLPPCVISAACAFIGAGLGYAFIEETLPNKRRDANSGTHAASTSDSHADAQSNEDEPMGVMGLLSIPAMRALTISSFALAFLSLAFDVVFTLFCYTPVDAGGLGLEPAMIGNAFGIAGVLAILLRLFVMPYILHRFEYAKTYNVCMWTWPFAFGLLPLLNILVRANPLPPSILDPGFVSDLGSGVSGSPPALVWTGLFAILALSKIGMTPHSLSVLLIKQHAPSPSALGRSNGLVQFTMCLGRTVAPMVVSSLFTGVNGIGWVKRHGVGWLWAVGMVVGAIAGARVTRRVGSGMGRS